MRTSIRSKALTGGAIALLTLAIAGCTDDPAPEPTDLEPAPVGETSDGGGESSEPADQGEDGSDSVAGACTLPAGDSALPNEAPDVDEWSTIQGIPVPISNVHGPEHRDGDLYTCYSQSATGALFASTYVFAASGYVVGFADNWVQDGSIPGAEDSEGNTEPLEGTITLRGYRVVGASEDKATIDLAYELATDSGTTVQGSRVILTWVDDRWYIDPAMLEQGNIAVPEDLAGYVPWSPHA